MDKKALIKPAINTNDIEVQTGSRVYPEGFRDGFEGRAKQALGNGAYLTQFGVNRVVLAPGASSANRHWHEKDDEFIFVLDGELTLLTNAGDQLLIAGNAAGFPAGVADAHQVINKSDAPATYLEIGSRDENEVAHYPDIDLHLSCEDGQYKFSNKKGDPY